MRHYLSFALVAGAAASALPRVTSTGCSVDECFQAANTAACSRFQTTTVFPSAETVTVTARQNSSAVSSAAQNSSTLSLPLPSSSSSLQLQTPLSSSTAEEAKSSSHAASSSVAVSTSSASRVADISATIGITLSVDVDARDVRPTGLTTLCIPAACSAPSAVSSACECLGIHAATVTAPAQTITTTHTVHPTSTPASDHRKVRRDEPEDTNDDVPYVPDDLIVSEGPTFNFSISTNDEDEAVQQATTNSRKRIRRDEPEPPAPEMPEVPDDLIISEGPFFNFSISTNPEDEGVQQANTNSRTRIRRDETEGLSDASADDEALSEGLLAFSVSTSEASSKTKRQLADIIIEEAGYCIRVGAKGGCDKTKRDELEDANEEADDGLMVSEGGDFGFYISSNAEEEALQEATA